MASSGDNEFQRFATLKEFERTAILLRSAGKSWAEIVATINAQFGLTYAETTVRLWFTPGGNLEGAYDEYNDLMAEQALKNAKKMAKRAAEVSITTMVEMQTDKHEDRIRLDAAKALANKYIPDRQVQVNEPGGADDLPPELIAAGEAIVNGQSDDAPEGSETASGAGDSAGQDIPAELLQQSGEPERSSDPPA